MDISYYLDEDDYRVEIGTIVQFDEPFCPCLDKFCNADCPEYIIVRLPDYGNMVEMVEVTVSWDETGIITQMRTTDPIQVLSVEPWKIGAI